MLRWLLGAANRVADPAALLGGLCERLRDAGVAVTRLSLGVGVLHPQIRAVSFVWRVGDSDARVFEREHGIELSRAYLDSPIAPLHAGRVERVRRRLDGPDARLDYPILRDLRDAGATDYLAMAFTFSDGVRHALSWATDAPGGFSLADEAVLDDVLPVLGLLMEARTWRRVAGSLLETYLGPAAGKQVLDGRVRRGDGHSLRAVLWFSDMRGFTQHSDALPRDRLLAMLNACFELQVAAIRATGGEVVKFMGDGVLGCFPIDDPADPSGPCCRALDAAEDALARLGALNLTRAAAGEPPIHIGLALHLGDMEFGNIGAPDRLDFTVIGPAVNLASRLEGLCRDLGVDLVLSEAVAPHIVASGRALASLGRHALRGLRAPAEIFTVQPRD